MNKGYVSLENLSVYTLSRQLSQIGWELYRDLEWRIKKIIGDQFIESTDSIGANVAEGYGRFHYLDKIRFYYNARGSLLESKHWFELLIERNLIPTKFTERYLEVHKQIGLALNGLIKSTMSAKIKYNP